LELLGRLINNTVEQNRSGWSTIHFSDSGGDLSILSTLSSRFRFASVSLAIADVFPGFSGIDSKPDMRFGDREQLVCPHVRQFRAKLERVWTHDFAVLPLTPFLHTLK
jgi:hypothetical protein